jgi:hypothetical protein
MLFPFQFPVLFDQVISKIHFQRNIALKTSKPATIPAARPPAAIPSIAPGMKISLPHAPVLRIKS